MINLKHVTTLITQNSPMILTAMGVSGVVGTAALAIDCDRKAGQSIILLEPLTRKETFKHTWAFYIPAVLMGATSISCIIGAQSINMRRNAALMGAYSLAGTMLEEYKEKVVEIVGENKAAKIKDATMQAHINDRPVSKNEILMTGTGEMLCFDALTGRYFKSDIETLRKAENDINHMIITDMYASLNDFTDAVGLRSTSLGEQLGWDVDNLVNLEFGSMLSEDNKPCLVMSHASMPFSKFHRLH